MFKSVLPRGAKLVSTAGAAVAGVTGLAPSEAECRAAQPQSAATTQLPKLDKLSISRADSGNDSDTWILCDSDELQEACFDIFGRKPRIVEVDGEISQGTQLFVSHDLSDEVESIESIGHSADRLMDSMHSQDGDQVGYPIEQLQAFSDATMYLASKPKVQQVVIQQIQEDVHLRQRLELILNGFRQPMLPPAAQNILVNDIEFEEMKEQGSNPFKSAMNVISKTLHKIGDGLKSAGDAIGGFFHKLANKVKRALNNEGDDDGNSGGIAVAVGALLVLTTAVILLALVKRGR